MLGGAFNPPHVGHLVLAQEAAAALGLDEVLLIPTGEPPHKALEGDPGAEVRLEMTERAVLGGGSLRVDPLEVEAAARGEGPSFTYRTVEALREREPDREIVLLLGADTAAGLADWRSPERIVATARIGVASRPGVSGDAVRSALGELGAEGAERVPMPEVGISSSMIRDRVAGGMPIRYLVPQPVVELIEERGLYRA